MRLLEVVDKITKDESVSCSEETRELVVRLFRECIIEREEIERGIFDEIRGAIKTALEDEEEAKAAITLVDRIVTVNAENYVVDEKRKARIRACVGRIGMECADVLETVRRQGKGVVYFGTARSNLGEVEYERTRELSREVYLLLGSTAYSGAGPGDMEAAIRGAKEAGGRVGGIKIILTEEQSKFEQNITDYLDVTEISCCQFFNARKLGLTDAAMRESEEDRTGVICLPGGFGTLDELSDFSTLKQLKKLGTKYTVPVLLMNYDGEYDGLIMFFERAVKDGRIFREELSVLKVCNSNKEALDHLADFYVIPEGERSYLEEGKLRQWHLEATS